MYLKLSSNVALSPSSIVILRPEGKAYYILILYFYSITILCCNIAHRLMVCVIAGGSGGHNVILFSRRPSRCDVSNRLHIRNARDGQDKSIDRSLTWTDKHVLRPNGRK